MLLPGVLHMVKEHWHLPLLNHNYQYTVPYRPTSVLQCSIAVQLYCFPREYRDIHRTHRSHSCEYYSLSSMTKNLPFITDRQYYVNRPTWTSKTYFCLWLTMQPATKYQSLWRHYLKDFLWIFWYVTTMSGSSARCRGWPMTSEGNTLVPGQWTHYVPVGARSR